MNHRTRIRDQERAPVAADLKRVLREKARLGEKTFALTADVAEAHTQIPIHPRDWHFLGSQIEVGGDVYINKVGTFGVASASYYWSRAASALGRLTQYITGRTANTWHQLVADDFHLEASGTEHTAALISFFVLCSTAGVPLSWEKTAGGDKVTWVGFELLHDTYHLGISERRAAWFIKWAEEVASSQIVNTASFEGLGRLMCVAGATRTREALPVSAPQLLLSAPQRSCKESAFLREVFPAIPLTSSLAVSSLQLRDGDASLGNSPSGRRTGERRQDRDRRLGTRT